MNTNNAKNMICPFMSWRLSQQWEVGCYTVQCMAWHSLGRQDTGDMFRHEDRPEVGYCKLIDKDVTND